MLHGYVICNPFSAYFLDFFYRDQQERIEAELTIPQHSLGHSAIYYDCLHYPGGMVNVITTSVAFEYNHPDVKMRISTINKNRNHDQYY